MNDFDGNEKKLSTQIPWWVKSILILAVTGVFCYKIWITPFNLQFDFPAFLSLILAIFSIFLSAMFYFKATETSNKFYDNTYKFSHEMGTILAKIESGFGEKLSSIIEDYRGVRDMVNQLPNKFAHKEPEQELNSREVELSKIIEDKEKTIKEKEQIINDIASKASLNTEEKEAFKVQLEEKEKQIQYAMNEINELMDRINQLRAFKSDRHSYKLPNIAPIQLIINKLGGDERIINMPFFRLQEEANKIVSALPLSAQNTLKHLNIIDDSSNLTPTGYKIINDYVNYNIQHIKVG